MKGGRGLAIAAIAGLGLWAWQRSKAAAAPVGAAEERRLLEEHLAALRRAETEAERVALAERVAAERRATAVEKVPTESLKVKPTQQAGGQIVVETNRPPTIPETIEIASQIIEAYPAVATVTLPSWTGEGEVHYDAPSIVQAAEMSGMSTEAWIALYGYGVTP